MYRITLLLLAIALFAFPSKSKASHAAGAEITYVWLHDSTFQIDYHLYRDCKGIPEPGSVTVCISNSCGLSIVTPITLNKLITIPPGVPNGTEVLHSCPGRPSTCVSDTSTIPGYAEWWYEDTVTLSGTCAEWKFSHAESARNNAIINLVGASGTSLYVEAMLNNKDAPTNSSPYFNVKPVPYICNNNPFTYNQGAYDVNMDSMDFETLQPATTSLTDCPPTSPVPYITACSLPYNPLPCGGTFVFSNTTGQMSFTPDTVGPSVLTVRANEWRYIGSTWKKIGYVMRDIQVVVRPCAIPSPTVALVPGTISGGTLISGTIYVSPGTALYFCYDSKAGVSGNILTVNDNHLLIDTSSSVSYTGMYCDSVRGCFSWTPTALDSGLKILTVTAMDSTCTGIGLTVPVTYTIPIYVYPSTTIIYPSMATPAHAADSLCAGDTLALGVVGGGSFTWGVLPGGSPLSSLSCTSCARPVARPTVTTSYTVHSGKPLPSKTDDTLTVYVGSSTPTVAVHGTLPKPVLLTADTFKAVTTGVGAAPTFTWYKNSVVIPGATNNVYVGFYPGTIAIGDVIGVQVKGVMPCRGLDSVFASTTLLDVPETNTTATQLNIHPNPNNGSFTLQAQLNTAEKEVNIEILNYLGQVVWTQTVVADNGAINAQLQLPASLQSGLYLLSLKQKDLCYFQKLSIQR